jgi:branched-chain amino acid transport system substrate-binding protein
MMKRTLLLLPLAALLLSTAAAAEIVLGAAGPFSGPNAALGEQLRRGVELAVQDINATGGLRGEPLAVKFTDDGCDPRKAVEAATGFVSAGVKGVIGHYCSGSSIPASKVYLKAGLVEISPASTNPKYTDEGGWNVLRLAPRDDSQAASAVVMVLEKFAGRKVAILNDQAPASAALAARFRDGLAAAGVAAVVDDVYKPGAKDYSALAGKLKDAGAEVLYLAGSYVEGGLIVRQLREAGSAAQVIGTDQLLTEDFGNVARDAAEGTLLTFTYDARKFPAALSVIERFRDADYNPEGFTLYAYAAVQAWVAAAEATGGTDSVRIAEWLRAGNRVNTVTGEIRFDAKGDLQKPAIAWFKWIDGRYAEIDPATLEPPMLDTTPSP